jgi:hypothetical protein
MVAGAPGSEMADLRRQREVKEGHYFNKGFRDQDQDLGGWLRDVTKLVFGFIPPKMYFKAM